jgi:hypothetical protein
MPNAKARRSIFAATSAGRSFCPSPPVLSRRANLGAAVDKIRTFKQRTKFAMSSGLALALALAIWSPLRAQTAEPQQTKSMMTAPMMEKCQEMKAQKQRVKKDIAAQEAQLTEQLSEMNHAPEDKKVGLMAAVVTHMVEQQISMHAQKAKMEDEMMQHMMRHMQMGKESMAQCPMMNGMKDMSSTDPRKGHHPEPK